ncbi:MAG: hypothetical protein Kow00117_10280 [Phototrophicales bacterium]
MSKILLIARREYLYNLKRPAFLFAAFGTPVIILSLWLLVFLVLAPQDEPDITEFGYVDLADIISPDLSLPQTISYTFIPFADEASAMRALEAETIGAYFVIPPGYADFDALAAAQENRASLDEVEFGKVQMVSYGDEPDDLIRVFNQFLVWHSSHQFGIDGMVGERISDPAEMIVELKDTGRELSLDALPVLFLLPMFLAVIFWIATQTTSGFLMNGLVEEKKNRIMEIIITTITPMQLLMGKIIGLGLLGLTQMAVWIGLVFVFLILGPQFESLAFLESIPLPFDVILVGIVYFALGYFLSGSILSAIGVLASSEQQSNQYAALVNLPGYLIPLFLLTEFIRDSNSTLSTVLSLIPITAPVSMTIRVGLGAVPLWQIALGVLLLLLTIFVATWGSSKVFRWGLLLYGKKITPREIIQVIRGRAG